MQMPKSKLPIYALPKGGYRIRPSLYNPYTQRSEQKDFQNVKWTYDQAKKELEKIKRKSANYFKPQVNEVLNTESQLSGYQLARIQRENDTLNDLYDRWSVYRNKAYRSSYNEALSLSYSKYIKESLGIIKLKDITQFDVTQWTNNLTTMTVNKGNQKRLGEPLKDKSINQIITVLSNLIKYGRTHESLNLNFNAYRIKENDIPTEEVAWTDKEISFLLKIIKEDGNEIDIAFFSLLALTGVRKGEARALRCSNIDFENKTVLVDRNLWRKPKGSSETSFILGNTKGKDKAYLPLGERELELLRLLISKHELTHDYDADKFFIFGGLAPKSANYFQTHFDSYKAKLSKTHPEINTNLKIHGFRHSVATTLAVNNSIHQAQQQLRHKDSATSQKYIHGKINPEIAYERSKILHGE